MRRSWSSLLGGCLGAGSGSGAAKVRRPLGVTVPFTDQDLPAGSSDPDCLRVFTFAELSAAAGGFHSDNNLIGVCLLGAVYKALLVVDHDDENSGVKPAQQAVAVRVINRRDAALRREEPLEEAIFLGKLRRHPNLVKMIGYCREKAGEVAVYEYMAHGSLDKHLFRRCTAATTHFQADIPAVLPWSTRLNIAVGVARALSFLHDAGAEKPFVHGDLTASNILLDEQFNAKLLYERLPKDYLLFSGCRLGMTVVVGGPSRLRSPEYYFTIDACLTVENDVYDFGVVLLELLAGRRSLDYDRGARPVEERNLVEFARPSLLDPRLLRRVVDPALERRYPAAAAQTMAMVAYKCLEFKPKERPDMAAVVQMLEPLLGVAADGIAPVDAAGSLVAPAP